MLGHVVVGVHGLERAADGAEPEACAPVGLTDLGHPLALGPLADTAVGALLVRPAFAVHANVCKCVTHLHVYVTFTNVCNILPSFTTL